MKSFFSGTQLRFFGGGMQLRFGVFSIYIILLPCQRACQACAGFWIFVIGIIHI